MVSKKDVEYFVKQQNEIMRSILYVNGITLEDLVSYADAQKYLINNLKLKYALLQQTITEDELMNCDDTEEDMIINVNETMDLSQSELPEELSLTLIEENYTDEGEDATYALEMIQEFHNYCKSSDGDEAEETIRDDCPIVKNKPYCCRCNSVLSDTNEFIAHMSQIHPRQKRNRKDPFQCEICGRLFTYEGVLRMHKKSHSNEVFFTCELCGTSFKGKVALNKHLLSHQNQRTFLCSLCPKRFNTKDVLNAHTYMVHQPDKWRHQCPICDKKFSLKPNMIAHTRTHKVWHQQSKPKQNVSKTAIEKES